MCVCDWLLFYYRRLIALSPPVVDCVECLQMTWLNGFYEGWRDLMDNKSDPRTADWPLMSSPFPTIAISLTYAYCVKVGLRRRSLACEARLKRVLRRIQQASHRVDDNDDYTIVGKLKSTDTAANCPPFSVLKIMYRVHHHARVHLMALTLANARHNVADSITPGSTVRGVCFCSAHETSTAASPISLAGKYY